MKNGKTIFWDFNGTMLDDTQVCIDAMNLMLEERGLPLLDEIRYRDVFTFPVKEYYSRIGFDFETEPFEKPAIEFIENYDNLIRSADIFGDAEMALEEFRSRGYTQMILSAMQNDFLNELVLHHSIDHYFTKISGIEDHYASGKVENARKLITSLDGHEGEIILIGDTVHDHEVGEKLGIRVILVSRGHQSEERIRSTGREIVHNFSELIKIIN